MKYTLIVLVLSVFLAACSKGDRDDMQGKAADMKDKLKDSVWSAQAQAVDKAKAVGQTVMDAAQQQREAIEKDQ